MGYDYEILYRPGHENSAADALSRRPNSPTLHHLHLATVTLWDEIKEAYIRNKYIQLVEQVAKAQPNGPYSQRQGLWLFKHRVIIPTCQLLCTKLLYEAHNNKIGGHSGVLRTFKRLAHQFYWPKMQQDVQEYVQRCEVCQRMKTDTLSPVGLLQPLLVPCQVWDGITLDFVAGLPTSHGKDTILVVVDRLSKFAHFLPLSLPFTVKRVAERFVEGIIKQHSIPKSIISDRDSIFISQFW